MRVAVVGHVEWVTFLRIDRPLVRGGISTASAEWAEPAGGGGVAAVELARLAGGSTLYTALGDDAAAAQSRALLEALGVRVRAPVRPGPQRRGTTVLDGERTIVVIGPAQAPLGTDPELADLPGTDAVYLCKGDAGAVRAARAARVLVATARMLPILREAGVRVDVLVRSAHDESEAYADGDLDPAPRIVVATEGEHGGSWRSSTRSGRWEAQPLPGPLLDTYGAGDSFAAALAHALGAGQPIEEALVFAAGRSALALCRPGAHGGAGAPVTRSPAAGTPRPPSVPEAAG